MNKEIVRMNLTGLAPELLTLIKALSEATILSFTGEPESAAAFREACDLIEIIDEIEAAQ